jgi:hypothetical protein
VATIARALKAFGSADFRADPQASLPLELALVAVALKPAEPEAAPTFAEARQSRRPAPGADQPAAATPAARAAPPPVAPTPTATTPAASTPAARAGATPAPPPATPAPARAQPVDQLAALRERLAARDSSAARATPAAPEPPAPPPLSNSLSEVAPPSAQDPAAGPAAEAAASEPPTVGANGDAPAAPASLSEARARYRDVYRHMQAASRLIASRLNGGDIIGLDQDSVTFGLPFPIQVEKLAPGTDAHRALVEAVAETFGRRYTVHCVHMKDVEDRLRAQPTRASHLLDEAIKLGARPLGPDGG